LEFHNFLCRNAFKEFNIDVFLGFTGGYYQHSAKTRARADHSKGCSALSLTPIEIQVELGFIPNKRLAGDNPRATYERLSLAFNSL
jgi:hypothetical protein